MSDIELDDCAACEETKPVEGGDMVVTYTTRVDGFVVSEDSEFVCADCLGIAEEAQLDRQLSAREWAGYDRWESEARNGEPRTCSKGMGK